VPLGHGNRRRYRTPFGATVIRPDFSQPGSGAADGPIVSQSPKAGTARSGGRTNRRTSNRSTTGPVPYDFRRPTKLTREHVRMLQMAYETFARRYAADADLVSAAIVLSTTVSAVTVPVAAWVIVR